MWFTYALLCALFFGLRGVFYQWTSQKNMNRNLMLCGVFFTGFVVSTVMILVKPPEYIAMNHIFVGLGMGVFSFSANACLYKGYAVGKASLVSVLAALPPVIVVILAYILWKEALSQMQLFSFAIIVIGINLVRYSNDLSFKDLKGAQWGLLAALFFGLNDILGKLSTRVDAELFLTLALMFGMGSLLFFIGWLLNQSSNNKKESIDKPWTKGKTFSVGMLVGLTNIGGMIAIIPAFRTGPTGMVSAIAALSVLVVLSYTRFFLKIPFRRIELIGISVSILGLLVLRLF
jgi:drug/metabolite transporter (DMT)-like permease